MSKISTLIAILKVLIKNPYALKRVLEVEERQEKVTHDSVYDAQYFEFVEQTTARSADTMVNSIVRSLQPVTVIDVGCGTGVLLDRLRAQGIQVKGLEYANAALNACRARGLNVLKFDVTSQEVPAEFGSADVVISMEVGQQLPEASADRFVDVLCGMASVVVFSSATPGQGDRKPLNEQPHQYWIDKFRQRQYLFDEDLSQQWREDWKEQEISPWFYRNVMVFRKITAN